MAAKRFAVGLDAGGSKTLLLAQCDGCSDRIERRGPPANPQRSGLEASADTLATLVWDVVRPHRPVDSLSVCAGVAGAGRGEDQEALTEHLHQIALFGGMLQKGYFARLLRRTLHDRLPEWSIQRLRRKPAVGALRRARRLLP